MFFDHNFKHKYYILYNDTLKKINCYFILVKIIYYLI